MNKFAKIVDLPGQQLLVQMTNAPIPCPCTKFTCSGVLVVAALVFTTSTADGQLQMVIAPDTKPLAAKTAQQVLMRAALDVLTKEDAAEAVELLLSSYHEVITMQECSARIESLRTSLLARAGAAVDAAS